MSHEGSDFFAILTGSATFFFFIELVYPVLLWAVTFGGSAFSWSSASEIVRVLWVMVGILFAYLWLDSGFPSLNRRTA